MQSYISPSLTPPVATAPRPSAVARPFNASTEISTSKFASSKLDSKGTRESIESDAIPPSELQQLIPLDAAPRFDDILSQLTRAADEQSNRVKAAEQSLMMQLQSLHKKSDEVLHDPNTVQWVNTSTVSTTASMPIDEAPLEIIPNFDGMNATVASPSYASNIYVKTNLIGTLTKGLFTA